MAKSKYMKNMEFERFTRRRRRDVPAPWFSTRAIDRQLPPVRAAIRESPSGAGHTVVGLTGVSGAPYTPGLGTAA
jgi:hypothetical protein